MRLHKPLLAAALAASGAAFGQTPVDCTTLTNPLYVPGTSLVRPILLKLGDKLATASGADQMTVVYQSKSSCAAYQHVTDGTKMTGTAEYWDGTGVKTCALPTAGVSADLAVGDVTIQTCTGAAAAADVGEFQLNVQPVGIVVPKNSTQTAVTAEECYFLFKFGANAGYQVPPWTDPNLIIIRNPGSSTQLQLGFACGISGKQWASHLTQNSVSQNVLDKVVAQNGTGNAEKTVGILATDYYDFRRDQVKMLALQGFKQGCLGAVYPDSTATSFDKKNVRDGHYVAFGYQWSVVKVDGSKQILNARAKRLTEFLSGTTALNGADPVAETAKAGAVPLCAMAVKKARDGAELEKYDAATPCGCYFESVMGSTSCEACPSGSCSGGKVCRFGFCEAR